MARMNTQDSSKLTPEKIHSLIQKRAQEICMKRGCAPGNDWKDWFEAEKQIKRELRLK
ncbi:MAG: DUF2934 domain-containing protein [Candidatus Omnitrophota bacterium]